MTGSSMEFTIYDLRFTRRVGFFDGPGVASIGRAMAVRGEKAAAMFPEQRPELLAIGLRNRKRIEFGPGEKREAPLAMRRRQRLEVRLDLEEEHQPVRLSLI